MKWTWLVMAAVLLAGCSDGGKPALQEDDPFGDLDDDIVSGKGLIRGIVVDPTVTPIEGAKVAIQDGPETTTNAEGAFVIKDLEPGTYFLTISKPGYSEVQQSAEVQADVEQPAIVKVQLVKLPGTEPYVLQDHYEGWIACEYQYGFFLDSCDADTGVFGEPDSAIYFTVDNREPEWVQMEIMWEHTQEFAKSLTMTMGACEDAYCSPYDFGENTLCQNWGRATLWCKVGREESTRSGYGSNYYVQETGLGTKSSNGISLHMSADCTVCTPPETPVCGPACGVGLIFEQTFNAYLNVFYNFQPDPEWFFTVDGEHPVPDGA